MSNKRAEDWLSIAQRDIDKAEAALQDNDEYNFWINLKWYLQDIEMVSSHQPVPRYSTYVLKVPDHVYVHNWRRGHRNRR